eukprot:g4427.t1
MNFTGIKSQRKQTTDCGELCQNPSETAGPYTTGPETEYTKSTCQGHLGALINSDVSRGYMTAKVDKRAKDKKVVETVESQNLKQSQKPASITEKVLAQQRSPTDQGATDGVASANQACSIIDVESSLDLAQPWMHGNSDPRKVFVGGLAWNTTNEAFKALFTQFGEIHTYNIGLACGYGFVMYKEPSSAAQAVQAADSLVLNGRLVDCRFALPTSKSGQHVRKLFVGGLASDVDARILIKHFSQYGEVVKAVVMLDRATNRSRGFGFVTFANNEAVLAALAKPQKIAGRRIEVHKAMSREQIEKHRRNMQPNSVPNTAAGSDAPPSRQAYYYQSPGMATMVSMVAPPTYKVTLLTSNGLLYGAQSAAGLGVYYTYSSPVASPVAYLPTYSHSFPADGPSLPLLNLSVCGGFSVCSGLSFPKEKGNYKPSQTLDTVSFDHIQAKQSDKKEICPSAEVSQFPKEKGNYKPSQTLDT